MAQSKLRTNYSTLHIRTNGDVVIRPRRLLSVAGIIAGLLLAFGGIFLLIDMFSSFNIGDLLWGVGLLFFSYQVLRLALRSLQNPTMLIEKATRRIIVNPSKFERGARAFDMELSKFSGVAVRLSGNLGGGKKGNIYQVGLLFPDGSLMPLVEVPAKKIERAAEILSEATNLGIIQEGQ